jgi:energy-coupling factor transport system ATP-binding protein
MIRLTGLSYSYPLTRQPALKGIDLHVPAGQFCGVVGANGAGKSTLCYVLAGFIPHLYHGTLDGSAVVDGRSIADHTPGDLAGVVGLVLQNPFNQITGARFTVREEVAFGLENLGIPRGEMIDRVEATLVQTGLIDLADRSPYELSGGQQQRLAIASVLVMQPRLLILDEPTSQLDPVGTREVFATLSQLAQSGGMTVMLTGHRLEWLAAFAQRVIALADGQVVADGPPREVLASPEMLRYHIGQTRYTQAAREAQARGLVPPDRPLPVTLDQAIEFFR